MGKSSHPLGAVTSRPSSLQILSTSSLDSSPSVLLCADGERIVFNAGEGWQRLCVESGVKVSKCDTVCVTHLAPEAVGGLPGYFLTVSDSGLSKLTVCGPPGLKSFVDATRHFMQRDKLTIDVDEVGLTKKSIFDIKTVLVEDIVSRSAAPPKRARSVGKSCASYVCRMPAVLGKFDVAKAKALGVPQGPLYGKLKNGESVTLSDGSIVRPEEVVGPSRAGGSCAVVQCLSVDMIDSLASALQELFVNPVDCVVHMTPGQVAESEEYVSSFLSRFPQSTTHVTTHDQNLPHNESPFRTAMLDSRLLHRIEPDLYANPALGRNGDEKHVSSNNSKCAVSARPMLAYTLVPHRGLDEGTLWPPRLEKVFDVDDAKVHEEVRVARSLSVVDDRDSELDQNPGAEIVFLGTGSAIPSKHRNVSAIYLQCRADGSGMLMDAGEGTVGQLYRAFGSEATPAILAKLHAVWISHPHADHHLGLPQLLCERRKFTDQPLVLMAPMPVLRWLGEYCLVESDVTGTFIQVESSWICSSNVPHPQAKRLREDLGIESCWNVRVVHCPNAYGLIVRSVDGWKLCYSGDCRPSPELVRQASPVSILIHEATFEDEFQDDAIAKRHSTVSEAIAVGRDMRAHRTILTHFSQRYIEGPELDESTAAKVVVASDLMRVSFPDLVWAPRLMPIVRRIFKEREFPREHYPQHYPYLDSTSTPTDTVAVAS